MDRGQGTKLALGALIAGVNVLSGNSLILTVAENITVNLASDALGEMISARAPQLPPGAPLTRAYERALRRASGDLRKQYLQQYGKQSDVKAFALITDTAGSVADAQYPGVTNVGGAQQELARSLDALLYGHDERQVVWIKERLLEQVARTFQDELASDPEAWRLFHGWLIQIMNKQSAALQGSVKDLPKVLQKLNDSTAALDALSDATDRLETLLTEVRDELRRIAAGGHVTPPQPRTHTQNISDNAQVGAAIAGDVHGPITIQSGGVNYGSGNTINMTGDVVGGDKISGDKVKGDYISGDKHVYYGAPRPADTNAAPRLADTNADHVQGLINDYTRRLRILERQAAMTGIDTRPHIRTEMEDIRAEIARLRELLG
jgi:hypothetical protein